MAKHPNPYRITLRALLDREGYASNDSTGFFMERCDDSIVPALCRESCEVEPDGKCEHGCPSVLIACGLI